MSTGGSQFVFDQTGPDAVNKRAGFILLADSTMGYNGYTNDAHTVAPHTFGTSYRVTMQMDNNNRFGVPAGPNVMMEVRDDVMISPSTHNGTTNNPAALAVGNQITYVGTPNAAGEYFNGMIAEVVVYDRLLSTTELADVRSYMNEKYLGEVVPEPSSIVLAALGLLGLCGWGIRRRGKR